MTISLLIPTYERPLELKRCIQSILPHKHCFDQIIVSDNSSSGSARSLNKAFLSKILNITYILQEENLGEHGNRQFLVNHSTSEWSRSLQMMSSHADFSKCLSFLSPGTHILHWLFCGYRRLPLLQISRRIPKPISFSLFSFRETIIKDFLCMDFFPYAYFHPASYFFRTETIRSLFHNFSSNSLWGIGDDFVFLFLALFFGAHFTIIPTASLQYFRDSNVKRTTTNLSNGLHASYKSRIGIYLYLNDLSPIIITLLIFHLP